MRTLSDKVRVICHSLKMDSLMGIDPSRNDEFRSRIKLLPSAEEISHMDKSNLSNLSKRLERLQFDIDKAKNTRTRGFAVRHMVDRGIPPRMKPVLANWFRIAMNAPLEDADLQGPDKWDVDFPDTDTEIDSSEQPEHKNGCPMCGGTDFIRGVCRQCGCPVNPDGKSK